MKSNQRQVFSKFRCAFFLFWFIQFQLKICEVNFSNSDLIFINGVIKWLHCHVEIYYYYDFVCVFQWKNNCSCCDKYNECFLLLLLRSFIFVSPPVEPLSVCAYSVCMYNGCSSGDVKRLLNIKSSLGHGSMITLPHHTYLYSTTTHFRCIRK